MKSQDSYFATKLKNIHVSNFKFTLTYESSKNFFVANRNGTNNFKQPLFDNVLGIYETSIICMIGLNLKKYHVKTQLNCAMQ